MTFTVQNDDGTVENANSYVDVATVRAYWLDRGVDLASRTDPEIEAAAVKATDYMDAKYRWVGYQLYRLQGTQFPRGNVSTFLRGLPPALTNAACMLTNRALDKALLPDPVTDASGQQVTQVTEKIGPIETSKTFKPAAGAKDLAPEYPEVTLMLQGAGLIRSGNCGEIGRA